jgi:colanic acid/amylovoran biosynthesis glycosyltransferase
VLNPTITQNPPTASRSPAAAGLRVAFVVDKFPVVSEPFIIDQVAQLIDRGVAVEIFSFKRSDRSYVSQKFHRYEMEKLVRYLEPRGGMLGRLLCAWPTALKLLFRAPRVLARALSVRRFGRDALFLMLLYRAEPFVGRDFDVVHCHFGTVARSFVLVCEVLGTSAKIITSFYGYDVSQIARQTRPDYYDPLKRACARYFVMSHDMKRRVVAQGFPAEQVQVHPVSIEVDDYPFRVRKLADDEPLQLVSVGRFVEKKGIDDLLRAMAIVKQRAEHPVSCSIVGGGPLDQELRGLAASLKLDDAVEFKGFLTAEDMLALFEDAHVLVQPSKTAANGDME